MRTGLSVLMSQLLEKARSQVGGAYEEAAQEIRRASSDEPFSGRDLFLDVDDGLPGPARMVLSMVESLSQLDEGAGEARAERLALAFESYASARTSWEWAARNPDLERREGEALRKTELAEPANRKKEWERSVLFCVERLSSPEWKHLSQEAWLDILALLDAAFTV